MDPGRTTISVFGGSFDPPHLGHVWMCATALSVLEVDQVWWIPAAQHAFGKTLSPVALRLELCGLAVAPFGERARVVESPCEPGRPSYTIDELEALSARHPQIRFRLLVGADVAASLGDFHRADELLAGWGIDVVGRSGRPWTAPEGAADLRVVPVELPDVSSTEVRRRMGAGEDLGDLVPRAVWARYQTLAS
jgi:nicotinate-nucleotide adenylyltransferase